VEVLAGLLEVLDSDHGGVRVGIWGMVILYTQEELIVAYMSTQ